MTRGSSRLPSGFRRGLRAALPAVAPTLALGVSFGLLAEPVIGAVPAVLFSALVWSGTAQFASLGALAGGAGALIAVGTGLLANLRYVMFGFAIAPDLTDPPRRRTVTGAALADASFVIAQTPDGHFDRDVLEGAAPPQYLAWLVGTALGVTGGTALGDPAALGLDVVFPVFYLSLLLPELRRARPLAVAVLAAVVALLAVPFTPAGVPVLAGAAVAVVGLVDRDEEVS